MKKLIVIPAKAGISLIKVKLISITMYGRDSRFRGNDEEDEGLNKEPNVQVCDATNVY